MGDTVMQCVHHVIYQRRICQLGRAMAPTLLLTDFVLGYEPAVWGNSQWATDPGVQDSTTTAHKDPGRMKISSVGRPRSDRP